MVHGGRRSLIWEAKLNPTLKISRDTKIAFQMKAVWVLTEKVLLYRDDKQFVKSLEHSIKNVCL